MSSHNFHHSASGGDISGYQDVLDSNIYHPGYYGGPPTYNEYNLSNSPQYDMQQYDGYHTEPTHRQFDDNNSIGGYHGYIDSNPPSMSPHVESIISQLQQQSNTIPKKYQFPHSSRHGGNSHTSRNRQSSYTGVSFTNGKSAGSTFIEQTTSNDITYSPLIDRKESLVETDNVGNTEFGLSEFIKSLQSDDRSPDDICPIDKKDKTTPLSQLFKYATQIEEDNVEKTKTNSTRHPSASGSVEFGSYAAAAASGAKTTTPTAGSISPTPNQETPALPPPISIGILEALQKSTNHQSDNHYTSAIVGHSNSVDFVTKPLVKSRKFFNINYPPLSSQIISKLPDESLLSIFYSPLLHHHMSGNKSISGRVSAELKRRGWRYKTFEDTIRKPLHNTSETISIWLKIHRDSTNTTGYDYFNYVSQKVLTVVCS